MPSLSLKTLDELICEARLFLSESHSYDELDQLERSYDRLMDAEASLRDSINALRSLTNADDNVRARFREVVYSGHDSVGELKLALRELLSEILESAQPKIDAFELCFAA